MTTRKYCYLYSNEPKELHAGRVLRVTDGGMVTINAISAVDLLLGGDGPYVGTVERPISQATFFDDRFAMLEAAKSVYQMNS